MECTLTQDPGGELQVMLDALLSVPGEFVGPDGDLTALLSLEDTRSLADALPTQAPSLDQPDAALMLRTRLPAHLVRLDCWLVAHLDESEGAELRSNLLDLRERGLRG